MNRQVGDVGKGGRRGGGGGERGKGIAIWDPGFSRSAGALVCYATGTQLILAAGTGRGGIIFFSRNDDAIFQNASRGCWKAFKKTKGLNLKHSGHKRSVHVQFGALF